VNPDETHADAAGDEPLGETAEANEGEAEAATTGDEPEEATELRADETLEEQTESDTQEVTDVAEMAQGDVAIGTDDESTPLARELTDITRRRRLLADQKLPLPESTRIFTVANQKGGVGKTTSTVNLAAALARQGARVLVIDLDPQGNASTALGVEHRSETVSVYDVIINDEPMSDAVQKSPEFDALFCLPATIHLAGAEIELVSLVAREQRLHTALETFLAESEDPFHYVFIDCPPSLGLLTINAFVAANEVLIPIQCEYYALEGLSQLLTNIQLIERHLNPKLAVSTILLTMFDSRTNLANQVAQEVRDHFPDQVLSTLIPRSVRISEAPSYGQSVISYDGNSSGSLSYLEAAAEIARRGVPT
jgi:chromosome partitioning protein